MFWLYVPPVIESPPPPPGEAVVYVTTPSESATRYLVFEQNTTQTRDRFLAIVNPYLEQVRAQQGLSAFRVVMDGTNNTPDLIDMNVLYGQLFLQPTRTAEFIVLDFIIQATGATFPE